jgi:hypothetical protein
MHLLCSGKNRVGSSRLSENLGVTGKTAWSIRHRIREALRQATMPARLLDAITHDRPPTSRNTTTLKRPARTPRPWSIPWNMTRNPFTPLPTISKIQTTTSWTIKGIGALE